MGYLQNIKKVVMTHWVVIVLSFLTAIIYVAPHIYFRYQPENNYRGIYISRTSDEETYLSIIKKISGGYGVGNPYLKEYRYAGYTEYCSLIEYFLAGTAKIFDLAIADLALVSNFIFPFILFLAIYLFIFELSKNKYSAISGSALILLGSEMVSLSPSAFMAALTWKSQLNEFLTYARPVNPSVSSIFFFVALYLILKLYRNPASKQLIVVSGLFVGLLAYIYFYFWAFALILNGVILTYSLLFKKWILVKSFLISCVAGVIVASPFLIKMFGGLFGAPSGSMAAQNFRRAFIPTHEFIYEKIIFLPLIIFVGFYIYKFFTRRSKTQDGDSRAVNEKYLFLFFLLISAFIASNQQIISGMNIQQHHFHFFTNTPVFFIIVAVVIFDLIGKYLCKLRNIIFAVLMIVVSLHAVGIQASSYKFWQPSFVYYQNYAEIFGWLNNNAAKESVVYANGTMSEMIPMYTSDYVYSAAHAAAYPVPAERFVHNYFTELFLRGVNKSTAHDYFYQKQNRDEAGILIFEGQYWRDTCGSYGCFPDATLDNLIEKYKVFLSRPMEENFKKYKIDYFVWDKNRDPDWRVGDLKFLEPVFEYKNIVVSKVK